MVIRWCRRGKLWGFVLKLVPNRKDPTILNMVEECVVPGSIIVTDGYPSYPRAVTEFGSCHEVVNVQNGDNKTLRTAVYRLLKVFRF